MDSFEAYRVPVSDPEADGLPEIADPDSHADEALDEVRIADGPSPYALPPDREDGPLGLDDYATSSAGREGEPLFRKLRREVPDIDPERVAGEDGRLAVDTPDAQKARRADEDAELLAGAVVDPNLDSAVSMYDRVVPGIPSLGTVGRLTAPDGDALWPGDSDLTAQDAGNSGGGFTAEEAAMHEVPGSELADDGDAAAESADAGPAGEAELVGAADYGDDLGSEAGIPVRTGSEQAWDPEDLAVAEGHDPTPAHVRHAQEELDALGPAAIEKTVP